MIKTNKCPKTPFQNALLVQGGEESAKYFAQTGLIVPARIEASKVLNRTEHNEKVFLDAVESSKNTFVFDNYKKYVDDFNMKNF